MRKISKILSAAIAAMTLVAAAPAAHARSHTYDFDGTILVPEITMPADQSSYWSRPSLTITNNTTYKWDCYSLLGAPEEIKPVFDVYLYSEDTDYWADKDTADMITDAPNWLDSGGNSYLGSMNPGATYTDETTYNTSLHSGPLAIFTRCSTLDSMYSNVFHYTVVDEEGNKIPELIPDIEAIRAEVEYVEPEPVKPEPVKPEPIQPQRSGSSLLSS